MKFHPRLLLLIILFSAQIKAQDLSGAWAGQLDVGSMKINLIFHLEESGDSLTATMDSPDQGAFGIPATSVSFNDPVLEVEMVNLGISYSANLVDARLEGEFRQSGLSFPLNLTRALPEDLRQYRPQEPVGPFPYRSEEVIFENSKDSLLLAGTLTLPSGNGPFPAMVLISGSGPQDRNSELFGHKPFWVQADYYTRKGIAVLRYDERGVGASEGEFSTVTYEDLTLDAQAAVKYLRSRQEIDAGKIGLLGHSEGGIIAPKVALSDNEISFLVLLAAPVMNGDQLMLLQKEVLETKMGLGREAIIKAQEALRPVYEVIIEGKLKGAPLFEQVKLLLQEQGSQEEVNAVANMVTQPFFMDLLRSRPSETLAEVNIPVLALFGENDLQVPANENSVLLEEIKSSGNKDFQILTMENLNHLFQVSETGMPQEYGQLEQTISPEVLELISGWILERH